MEQMVRHLMDIAQGKVRQATTLTDVLKLEMNLLTLNPRSVIGYETVDGRNAALVVGQDCDMCIVSWNKSTYDNVWVYDDEGNGQLIVNHSELLERVRWLTFWCPWVGCDEGGMSTWGIFSAIQNAHLLTVIKGAFRIVTPIDMHTGFVDQPMPQLDFTEQSRVMGYRVADANAAFFELLKEAQILGVDPHTDEYGNVRNVPYCPGGSMEATVDEYNNVNLIFQPDNMYAWRDDYLWNDQMACQSFVLAITNSSGMPLLLRLGNTAIIPGMYSVSIMNVEAWAEHLPPLLSTVGCDIPLPKDFITQIPTLVQNSTVTQ